MSDGAHRGQDSGAECAPPDRGRAYFRPARLAHALERGVPRPAPLRGAQGARSTAMRGRCRARPPRLLVGAVRVLHPRRIRPRSWNGRNISEPRADDPENAPRLADHSSTPAAFGHRDARMPFRGFCAEARLRPRVENSEVSAISGSRTSACTAPRRRHSATRSSRPRCLPSRSTPSARSCPLAAVRTPCHCRASGRRLADPRSGASGQGRGRAAGRRVAGGVCLPRSRTLRARPLDHEAVDAPARSTVSLRG